MPLTKNDLKSIDELLERRLSEQRKTVNQNIADFISDNITPQLDEISETIERIERSFGKHEDRFERLEKIHPDGKHSAHI